MFAKVNQIFMKKIVPLDGKIQLFMSCGMLM